MTKKTIKLDEKQFNEINKKIDEEKHNQFVKSLNKNNQSVLEETKKLIEKAETNLLDTENTNLHIVKNISVNGLVFLESHESDCISLAQRLLISCISTISISNSFKAFSLSSGGRTASGSFWIKFLTSPSTPASGNTSPTVPIIPGAAVFRNLPTLVSENFFLGFDI